MLDEELTIADLDPLICEFFRFFARFEYALKEAKFFCGSDDIKADWCRFAKEKAIVSLFESENHSDDLKKAAAYLLEKPPQKQGIRDGRPVWKSGDPGRLPKAELLLCYVRRVRNNLFHGGKENANPPRTEALLRHGLVILEACLDVSPNVSDTFRIDRFPHHSSP